MTVLQTLKLAAAGVVLTAGTAVSAQGNAITFLVGFPAGGSTDMIARVVGEHVSKDLNRPVVVENRPGAGGRVAALAMSQAAPNGNTYVVMPNASAIFNHLLYSTETLGYDVLEDLAPVAVLTSGPMGLAVNADLGVETVEEYVQWVKDNGGEGFFGTAGQGGQTHFSGLAFGEAAGIDMRVVPYRGNAPMINDLLGGQVPAGVSVVGDILPHVESGRIRLLAVFGDERSPIVPDVPTFQEAGVDVVAGESWAGIWTRAGTPAAEVQRMQEAIQKALALPAVQETFRRANLVTDYLPGDQMAAKIASELEFWAPVIEESGFTPEQ